MRARMRMRAPQPCRRSTWSILPDNGNGGQTYRKGRADVVGQGRARAPSCSEYPRRWTIVSLGKECSEESLAPPEGSRDRSVRIGLRAGGPVCDVTRGQGSENIGETARGRVRRETDDRWHNKSVTLETGRERERKRERAPLCLLPSNASPARRNVTPCQRHSSLPWSFHNFRREYRSDGYMGAEIEDKQKQESRASCLSRPRSERVGRPRQPTANAVTRRDVTERHKHHSPLESQLPSQAAAHPSALSSCPRGAAVRLRHHAATRAHSLSPSPFGLWSRRADHSSVPSSLAFDGCSSGVHGVRGHTLILDQRPCESLVN
jgi:hypothetical protein